MLPLFATGVGRADDKFASHPPTRALPTASQRALASGRAYYVDPQAGDDASRGDDQAPWRTLAFALPRLEPADTLYLRGGVYYEQAQIRNSGMPGKPITIRSFPGELAIIDGGLAPFAKDPANAWEPSPSGPLEFRSRQRFPQLERVVGNFADSLIPLHAYRFSADLRASHEAPLPGTTGDERSYYMGPGVWYDTESERIHVRLAPTHIRAFGSGNYRGETDPRKLSLVIAAWNRTPLQLLDAKHIRVQDLVVRGGGDSTLLVRGCQHVEFDGVTLYVANRGMRVETSGHLRVVHCAFRGPMPPWGSRSASKYRTTDSHLFIPVGTYKIERDQRDYLSPQCHDFEVAHCEFTDGHDGVYVGGVQRFKFHHNLVDNMNDDGVYLSAWGPPGSAVHVHQNVLSRCLTLFAFGLGRGSESDPGQGTFIYRNVIDLRAPVPYAHPAPAAPRLESYGRLCGDHGGPIWEPIHFYHNVVLTRRPAFRGYYGAGLGGHMRGTRRRILNNIFVQIENLPGLVFDATAADLQAGGNLHWSVNEGAAQQGDFFAKFRSSKPYASSKSQDPAGWTHDDRFADPRFRKFAEDGKEPLDLRPADDSPAIDAGVPLPAQWPDPLRERDAGKPDVGAYPLGLSPEPVGLVSPMSPARQ